MTKRKIQEWKKAAPRATNKSKGSSSKAPLKKTHNNWKRPASDDKSSSDEALEKPHACSHKKAKKVDDDEEVQIEGEEDIEEVSDNEEGGGANSNEANHNKVSHGCINIAYPAIGSKWPWG